MPTRPSALDKGLNMSTEPPQGSREGPVARPGVDTLDDPGALARRAAVIAADRLCPSAADPDANVTLRPPDGTPSGGGDLRRISVERARLSMTSSFVPPANARVVSPALRDVLLRAFDDRIFDDRDVDVALAVRVARGMLPLVLDCDLEACVAALEGHLDVSVDSDAVFDRAAAAGPAGPCAAAACLTARRSPGVSLCWSHDAYVAARFDGDSDASLTFVVGLFTTYGSLGERIEHEVAERQVDVARVRPL